MDIVDITEMAKQFTQEDGGHVPTLFIETQKQLVIAELRDLPETTQEQALALIEAGRRYGQEHPEHELREVALILMAWASITLASEGVPTVRPSQHPNRIELLTVTHARLIDNEMTQTMQVFEVLRTTKTKKVDLVHRKELDQTEVKGSLVLSFFAGFVSARYNESELAQILEQHLKEN